jgi:hypothetical protein
MESREHPDPLADAMQHGVHRAVQVASCAATASQVYLYQQRTQARVVAEREVQARRVLNAQIRAARDDARAEWVSALDPNWLRDATLTRTAQAWGAAIPYADRSVPWYEPAAATAMRKSEDRLRDLHPYAMARYDRLRADGMGPAEAMYETAPLFARHPNARPAPSTPQPALTASATNEAAPTAGSPRPWAHDFPISIADVVAAASHTATKEDWQPTAAPTAAPQPAPARPPQP